MTAGVRWELDSTRTSCTYKSARGDALPAHQGGDAPTLNANAISCESEDASDGSALTRIEASLPSERVRTLPSIEARANHGERQERAACATARMNGRQVAAEMEDAQARLVWVSARPAAKMSVW